MYYTDDTIIFSEDRFIKVSEATIDPFSQTLHYGFGVFEGLRSYQSIYGIKIFKSRQHFTRMIDTCKLLGIPFEYSVEELIHLSYQLLAKNKFTTAYIRPIVYCGPNLSLSEPKESSLMIGAWRWGKYFGDKMLKVCVSSYKRPHPETIKPEAKVCGHYVSSIMATTEARKRGYDEGLMLDLNGFVAQGPGANFFFEKDGILNTAPVGNIFPGITRQTVFDICSTLDIPVREKLFRAEELFEADGAFFCSTAAEIAGVESFEGQSFSKPWNKSLGAIVQDAYKHLVLDKSNSYVIV
jgi:branched-chain amino acid aminotransferase